MLRRIYQILIIETQNKDKVEFEKEIVNGFG